MIPDKKKEGAVCEISCQDCDQTFVGETGFVGAESVGCHMRQQFTTSCHDFSAGGSHARD